MTKLFLPFALALGLCIPNVSSSQNLGVGTSTPSEKLEVKGKVYSNQGGFKFPDGTVQTTAMAQTDPEGESISRLFGAMEVDQIEGGYNNGPINDAIKVFELDIRTIRSVPIGGSPSPPSIPIVDVLVEVENSTNELFEKYVTGAAINEILIHLLNNAETMYYTIGMEQVTIVGYHLRLVHVGNGEYAHMLALTLSPNKLSLSNIMDNTCICWNWQTNNSCSCID